MLELKELVWKIPDGDTIIDGISCRLDSRLTVITGPNGCLLYTSDAADELITV